jgi:acetylornithine/N-succinyldiaminopimelate aminotransferase
MAKGIAGGFPFGAFAMSEAVAAKLEPGDHGGTYCGNPLGCAVAASVIRHLIEHDIASNVKKIGNFALDYMEKWIKKYPEIINEVRGKGLLLAIDFRDEKTAGFVTDRCLENRLFVRQTQGNMIRIFPALNIKQEEMEEGLKIIEEALDNVINKNC